jgi:hypothetical protein
MVVQFYNLSYSIKANPKKVGPYLKKEARCGDTLLSSQLYGR